MDGAGQHPGRFIPALGVARYGVVLDTASQAHPWAGARVVAWQFRDLLVRFIPASGAAHVRRAGSTRPALGSSPGAGADSLPAGRTITSFGPSPGAGYGVVPSGSVCTYGSSPCRGRFGSLP